MLPLIAVLCIAAAVVRLFYFQQDSSTKCRNSPAGGDMTDALAFSPAEAAEALGVSERTLRKLITRGELRVVRVGKRVLVPATVLREMLEPQATPA